MTCIQSHLFWINDLNLKGKPIKFAHITEFGGSIIPEIIESTFKISQQVGRVG